MPLIVSWVPLTNAEGRFDTDFGPLTQVMATVSKAPDGVPFNHASLLRHFAEASASESGLMDIPFNSDLMSVQALHKALLHSGLEALVVPPLEIGDEHYQLWMQKLNEGIDRRGQRAGSTDAELKARLFVDSLIGVIKAAGMAALLLCLLTAGFRIFS